MKFKQLEVSNLKIAVYESEGEGYPVVLLHANSIGAASFYWQMMSELGEKFKFISIDMPGHGASDFSFQPEKYYTIDAISDIVAGILQYYDFEECILCGHGLGAHVGIRSAAKIEKVKGLMLVGAAPVNSYQDMGSAYHIDEPYKLFYKGKMNEAEVSILAQQFISADDVAEIMFVDNIKNTDPNFRIAIQKSFKNDKTNDFNILKALDIPVTLLNGDKDRIVNREYLEQQKIEEILWRKKVQYISEAGNSPMWEKYKVFNYFVEQFVNDLV
jgi:pimeloyl-ACP methyl ester carboxylesterase